MSKSTTITRTQTGTREVWAFLEKLPKGQYHARDIASQMRATDRSTMNGLAYMTRDTINAFPGITRVPGKKMLYQWEPVEIEEEKEEEESESSESDFLTPAGPRMTVTKDHPSNNNMICISKQFRPDSENRKTINQYSIVKKLKDVGIESVRAPYADPAARGGMLPWWVDADEWDIAPILTPPIVQRLMIVPENLLPGSVSYAMKIGRLDYVSPGYNKSRLTSVSSVRKWIEEMEQSGTLPATITEENEEEASTDEPTWKEVGRSTKDEVLLRKSDGTIWKVIPV